MTARQERKYVDAQYAVADKLRKFFKSKRYEKILAARGAKNARRFATQQA